MTNAKIAPLALSWLTLVIVVAIVVVINLLADVFFFRLDLTQDKHYTLSPASKNIIDQLESPLHVKLFFSRRLPVRFEPLFAYIEDFIAEYRAYGAGKISVEVIDPGQDEALVREATALGIRETEANVTEKGRLELARIWFGLALIYEDRKQVFPSIGSIENFEYDISSAIWTLVRGARPKVLFIGPTLNPDTGIGHAFTADMQPLVQELSPLFDVSHVEVNGPEPLDLEDAVVAVCWGLHQYSVDQLYAVDQFIMSGKPVVFLVSGVRVDPARLNASEIPPSSADDVFRAYGFQVKRNLVADNNCQVIQKAGDDRPILDHYPLFPVISRAMHGFDPEFEPTQLMNSQLLPWVSELEPLHTIPDQKVRVIAQSSPQSWLQRGPFTLAPERLPGPTSFGSYCVGLELSGPLPSAFPEAPPKSDDPKPHKSDVSLAHLVVLGTDHILGQFQNQSTLSWMTNTLNYLTDQASLTTIARTENAFRPVKELTFAQRRRVQWASVLIAPMLIVAFGLLRQLILRKRSFDPYRQPPKD